jgi:membrane protease subunit HflC
MMGRILVPIVITVIAALIILPQIFFTVDETQLAIVTRFGEFREAHTEPGLQTKWPFVESVTKFDSRLLRADAPSASLLTADKRNLVIDSYARYKIIDPLLFFQTLASERDAASRVAAIVNSQLRSEVALDLQSDIISETREEVMKRVTIASNRSEIKGQEALKFTNGLRNPEITILLTPAQQDSNNPQRPRTPTEAELEALVISAAPAELNGLKVTYFQPQVRTLGIEIVDVRIKGADFPPDIASSVYERMKAERERIASGLRAEGEQRDAEIRADVNRQVEVIMESAQGRAAILRGEGEGEAIKILAEALQEDPEFYDFRRTLEAYAIALDGNTTLLLDANSDFFKFLQDPFETASSSGQ